VTLTPQQRAERSTQAMWKDDRASQWAGFVIEATAPGRATLSLKIDPHHCNGHGILHGGVIFMLADSAFAFACNSYNEVVVAQHCDITFLAPGKAGDRIVASAREVARSGRSGIYDIAVANGEGQTIAQFRGLSRVIAGRHFEEEQAQ
jgi:acyl-CoA thioesterase